MRALFLEQWLHFRSRWATPDWLNALPDEHRKIVARGPFPRLLREIASAHVTTFAWVMVPHHGAPEIHNGSMFFLDCGQGPIAITAAHVYHHYMAQRAIARRIICQIGDIEFDPSARHIEDRQPPDIATFRITAEEIAVIGKKVVRHAAANWPPVRPPEGYAVIIGGFPGHERLVDLRDNLTPREINFGFYYANTPVTVSIPEQITCRFERQHWVDSFAGGLPAAGYDLGGISGAPLLVPAYKHSTWTMELAGVITEAHCSEQWEQVMAATAGFLLPNGQIQLHV